MTQTAIRAPFSGILRQAVKQEPIRVKYWLYALKSMEAEDAQALSIESQVREMTALATRENLEIVEIKPIILTNWILSDTIEYIGYIIRLWKIDSTKEYGSREES